MSSNRPERVVRPETVTHLAEYAGIELDDERRELHVQRLNDLIGPIRDWDELELGFRFVGGSFGYAPSIAQFKPGWRWPNALNGGRRPAGRLMDEVESGDTGEAADAER